MKTLLGVVLAAILALAGYTWLTLHWTYSSGERAGYVQKFSRKGWLCKTWEGEMALVSMPGTVAEKFYFTVRDDAVAQRINATMGERVSLVYRQHIGVPTTCFGETQYFVDDVKAVAEPDFMPGGTHPGARAPDTGPSGAPTTR